MSVAGYCPAMPLRRQGFMLIELLVCVVVVAILASIALPMTEMAWQRNQEEELRHALRTIRDAIDVYKQAADAGRIQKAADESGYPASLAILVDGVVDAKSPSGGKLYFLRRIPRDPFNPDRAVLPEQTWGLRSYASPSTEPKPGRDVYDIYSLQLVEGLDGTKVRDW
jgi:general secretion pathway protein G